MSSKIQITGLEELVLEWGVDQSIGSKLGHQIVPTIPTIANAINSGATIGQALLAGAIQYGETTGATVSNTTLAALLPLIVGIAVAVESGKTPLQAIEAAAAALLAPPSSTAQFQPQSWLSEHLGLDSHPQLLATINSVLGNAAAAAGADVNTAVRQAVAGHDPSTTDASLPQVVADTAIGALKAAGATVTASDAQAVVGGILAAAPHLNDAERGFLSALANGLIGLVLHH